MGPAKAIATPRRGGWSVRRRPLTERRRILLSSIAIMVGASLSAAALAIYVLYEAAFEVHGKRLAEVAESRAHLITAVARFDAQYSQGDVPGGASAATLSQIVDAHDSFEGFGETGEFTLARREGDRIVWLLKHRHEDIDMPSPTPFHSGLAEPMRRALSGHSGRMVGPDYRGVEVLAAFHRIPELGWGVVAKIDIEEIRKPFVRAGRLVAGIAVIVIAIGVGLILRVTSPLIRRLETRTEELQDAHERLRAATSQRAMVQEQERRKLAVDLHDGLSQLLTLASMKLAMLRRSTEAEVGERNARELGQLIAEARERSGSVIFQLCPPVLYDVGLAEAAEWLAEDIERRYGLHVTVENDGKRRPLNEETRILLFRSLSELLINVAKHAGTDKASVRLWHEGRFLKITVEDKGVGFRPDARTGGYGLFSTRERLNHLGGTIQIDSVQGGGTRVVLAAPVATEGPVTDTASA